MKEKLLFAAMVLVVMTLAACGPLSWAQGEPMLQFEVAMQVNSAQEFHVSLGVHNAGQGAFEGDSSFNAQMEVRRVPSGDLRASAHVVPLRSLEPGETAWPMAWHGRLQAGTYELTWGAEGYGETSETFTIVEEDGRLYFRGDLLATPEPTPAEEQGAPVDEAISDLQGRLGVDEDEIAVATVEPFEFPDASLGVPERGTSYAQVIVPGYIIRLRVDQELYEYHAADGRLVLVPQDSEGMDDVSDGPSPHQRVAVPEIGLAFEVPADWERLEPESVWAPEAGSDLRLGVSAAQLEPPMEPESVLLPKHAQIAASDPVSLGWADGRRFKLEVYGPAVEGGGEKVPVESVQTHVLVVMERDGERLGVGFYASAPTAEALDGLEPPLEQMLDSVVWTKGVESSLPNADEGLTANWQVFEDETYGFRLRVPPSWTHKEMETEGAGVPEDWPLGRSVAFFPQAWAERFEEKSGPPNPSDPPVVPAISLEVYTGEMEQFRRAFPDPTEQEVLEINGIGVVREVDAVSSEVQLVRYVFQDPDDENLRVVIIDNYGGFPERRADHPEMVDLIRVVVGTFVFVS